MGDDGTRHAFMCHPMTCRTTSLAHRVTGRAASTTVHSTSSHRPSRAQQQSAAGEGGRDRTWPAARVRRRQRAQSRQRCGARQGRPLGRSAHWLAPAAAKDTARSNGTRAWNEGRQQSRYKGAPFAWPVDPRSTHVHCQAQAPSVPSVTRPCLLPIGSRLCGYVVPNLT